MTYSHADEIGVYVLGAVDADKRREMERRLQDCATCLAAVKQFAHLPRVLRSLSLENVVALRFDDGADPDVARRASPCRGHRRTAKRALLTAPAAVVLLVAGDLIGHQISENPASPRGPRAVSPGRR
jgi:anti-sigma factor RsiW